MDIRIQKQINNFFANYFMFLVLVVVVVILASGYLFILKPKKDSFKDNIDRESAAREQQYFSLKSDLSKLEQLSLAYQSIDSKNVEKLDKILPTKPDVEELMKQMEVIVFQNGLLLTSITLQDEVVVGAGVGGVSLGLQVVGTDYNGLKGLLRSVENNLRLLDVQKVNYAPDGKSTTLEIIAYYQI